MRNYEIERIRDELLNDDKFDLRKDGRLHKCRKCGKVYYGFYNPNDIHCRECSAELVVKELRIIGSIVTTIFIAFLIFMIIVLG